MKTWSNRFAILVTLAMALLAAGCAGDESDDDTADDESDDDSGNDDVSDDDSQDDDTWDDDDSELPHCPDYSYEPWLIFDESNVEKIFDDFDAYVEELLPGVVDCAYERAGLDWSLTCGDWVFTGEWLDADRAEVIDSPGEVGFYIQAYEYDGSYGMFILNDADELLVFDSDMRLMSATTDDQGKVYFSGEEVFHYQDDEPLPHCEYESGVVLPPLATPSSEWVEVFNLTLSGVLFGSPFAVPGPATPTVSDDGLLDILLPHYYRGTVQDTSRSGESDEEIHYGQEHVQAVRRL